jgi:hypothetical protein
MDWLGESKSPFSETPMLLRLLEKLYFLGVILDVESFIPRIEWTGQIPELRKWQLENNWKDIFFWLFLGKLDVNSEFYWIPIEVFFRVSELSMQISFSWQKQWNFCK